MEPDPDGNTIELDNRTSLPDGSYTPDGFAFSGGTGKVKISCPAITVTDGRSYATIVFSSNSYTYVKTNGCKYYAEVSGKNAVFEIPIVLNQNNTVFALTTKMSTPHEIEYTLLASLTPGGTQGDNADRLDDTPPALNGFLFSETLANCPDLRIFRYEGGLLLFEIDTHREPVQSDPIPEEELTPADLTAALYQKRVLKYLAAPEAAELPAGTEKAYILLHTPVSGVYAADNHSIQHIQAAGCENKLTAVGAGSAYGTFAGGLGELSYRTLVLLKTRLAIADESAAPLLGTSLTDRLASLGIALIVDQSSPQSEESWQQLYRLLLAE